MSLCKIRGSTSTFRSPAKQQCKIISEKRWKRLVESGNGRHRKSLKMLLCAALPKFSKVNTSCLKKEKGEANSRFSFTCKGWVELRLKILRWVSTLQSCQTQPVMPQGIITRSSPFKHFKRIIGALQRIKIFKGMKKLSFQGKLGQLFLALHPSLGVTCLAFFPVHFIKALHAWEVALRTWKGVAPLPNFPNRPNQLSFSAVPLALVLHVWPEGPPQPYKHSIHFKISLKPPPRFSKRWWG